MLENSFHSIDCAFVDRNLIQYHEQALPAESIKTIRSHVETCDSCAQSLTEYRQLEGMLYADSMQFQPVFSPEAQARVQRNVYRRVRWRLLLNRPFSFRVSHGFAALFLCLFAFMAFQRNQLSNDYTQLSAQYAALESERNTLVSGNNILSNDYVQLFAQYATLESKHNTLVSGNDILVAEYAQLEGNTQRVSAKVVAATDFTRDEGSTIILQEDLDKLLLAAVIKSNASDVRAILRSGANVDAIDSRGRTPLIHAIDRQNHLIIDMLLDQGADINAKSTAEGTPLYRAYEVAKVYGDSSFFEWLLAEGADLYAPAIGDTTVWSILSASKNVELIEMALAYGVNIDQFALYDRTPLMLAAASGHQEVVSTLLAAGADKTLKTEDGETAAELAWDANHINTAILIFNSKPVPKRESDFYHPRVQQFVNKLDSIIEMEFDGSQVQQLAMAFSHPGVIRARDTVQQ